MPNPLFYASYVLYLFPLFSFFILIFAYIKKTSGMSAVWLSLIAIISQYQLSGNSFFGTYFSLTEAFFFSANCFFFITSLLFICYRFTPAKKSAQIFLGFFIAAILANSFIINTNIWLNAFFIKQRFPNTPVIQVAHIAMTNRCQSPFLLLKINPKAKVGFLCPSGYGLIAKTGTLKTIPVYLYPQLPKSLLAKLHKKNIKWQTDWRKKHNLK